MKDPTFTQAARKVGLPTIQCDRCRGAGYLRATLNMSIQAIYILAKAGLKEPLPISYDECPKCQGQGALIDSEEYNAQESRRRNRSR